ALRYIDTHGLDALSMHKLGAELGVKGMSLYNHVARKDDLLDGVVELLWSEAESAAPATPDWREGLRSFAHALRDVVRRHPNAAALITSQQVMPEPALRAVQAHITSATDRGIPEERAYALLRTITSYALGSALAEVSWGLGAPGCAPAVSDLLRPGVPGELVGVAEVFCGQCDLDAQFELGLDLMLRGIECTQWPT
ncbi:MAG: TetR family transcriptional regulator, partial [Nitriliruptorales bacterium]|nr:TetR family transcriptional regulator [Nitriliruptorales bacterium]